MVLLLAARFAGVITNGTENPVAASAAASVRARRPRGEGGAASTMQRRTLGAVALALLPIALADDTVVAAATFGIAGFAEAFTASMGVIFGTELGDKTFFIAAIMSMRHPRFTVWFGAVGALAAMTVLSTIVGHVAPMLLPPSVRRSSDSMRPPPTRPRSPAPRLASRSPLLSLTALAPSVSPSPPHRPLPPRPLVGHTLEYQSYVTRDAAQSAPVTRAEHLHRPVLHLPAAAGDALCRRLPLPRVRCAHAERVTRGEQRGLRRARGGRG